MINGVYQTIRSIDAMARQRESLVALGTLAAGLAHEINNPAAAVAAGGRGLRDTCDTMLGVARRPRRDGRSSAEQFVELDRLRRELDGANASPTTARSRRMDREEAVGDWLDDHARRRRRG